MNRSGMAAKRSLVVGAHCIDSGYDGEVFIDMHNIGNQQQIITPGTKIAQLVMVPVVPFRAISSGGTGDLYDWAPIADELKVLDKEIVLNSIKLKWNLVQNEFDSLTKDFKNF